MPYSPPTGSLISLHMKVYIDPARVDEFIKHMQPVYDAVCAEPECVFFEIYHNEQEPGAFKWVENWNATADWLINVQIKKDYYKPYFEATEPMFLKPREFELWERTEGGARTYIDKGYYFPGDKAGSEA